MCLLGFCGIWDWLKFIIDNNKFVLTFPVCSVRIANINFQQRYQNMFNFQFQKLNRDDDR